MGTGTYNGASHEFRLDPVDAVSVSPAGGSGTVLSTPEPSTWVLIGVGLVVLACGAGARMAHVVPVRVEGHSREPLSTLHAVSSRSSSRPLHNGRGSEKTIERVGKGSV